MIIKEENNIGSTKATSTSKIKKITVTMKNFIQNGIRVIPVGSNPHSNGEDFSLSTTFL